MNSKSLAFAVLAAVVFAGCASADPASVSTSQPAATTLEENPDSGVLKGTVVDEEQMPIAGVTVGVPKLGVEMTTDDGGAFEILNVPYGEHDLVAAKLGYESVAKRVTIKDAEPVQVTIALAALVVLEGYHISQHHAALFHAASTYPTWILNMTGVSNSCEGCTWVINTSTPATTIQWEIYGKHTVANPQGDAEYLWIFRDNYAVTGGGERIYNNVAAKLPVAVSFDKGVIKKTTVFYSQILCDYYWFCLEEKRDLWFTAFYNEEMPEGFLAVPT